MTIHTDFQISGVSHNEVLQKLTCTSNIHKTSAASSFNASLDNRGGLFAGSFPIGQDILIKAELNVDPPTKNVFRGIIENIDYSTTNQKETMKLSGRDYTARLMDAQITAEVYNNLPAGSIVIDLINKLVDDVTTTNVDNANSATITHVTFKQISVYDAVKQLAETSKKIFYVDTAKDLNFVDKIAVTTFGIQNQDQDETGGRVTYDTSNVVTSNFRESTEKMFNEVYVFGDRILTKAPEESFSASTGSVYTLSYKPHNTDVGVNGSEDLLGGIFEVLANATGSAHYLVDFDQTKIVMIGTNNPSTGSVVVNYFRTTPIVKVAADRTSIDKFGKRTKIIDDKAITEPTQAKDIAIAVLNEGKEPKITGGVKPHGVDVITAGKIETFNFPNQDISSENLDVLTVKYDFTEKNKQKDSVMTFTINEKRKDAADTIKDIILDVRRLQAEDVDVSDVITRIELGAGSTGTRISGTNFGWKVQTRTLGSSFVLSHNVRGVLGSQTDQSYLGDSRTAFTIQQSGASAN